MSSADWAGLTAMVMLGAFASYCDVRYRRLPNWLCGILLLGGLLFTAMKGGNALLLDSAIHVVLALMGGLGLYALRIIGAGDAKYYAGMAAWFSYTDAIRLILGVSLAGLVVTVFWIVLSRARRRRAATRETGDFAKVPYGLAISLGSVLIFSFGTMPVPHVLTG